MQCRPAHGVDLYRPRMFGVCDQDAVIATVVRPSDVDRVSAVVRIEQQLGHRVDHHALRRRTWQVITHIIQICTLCSGQRPRTRRILTCFNDYPLNVPCVKISRCVTARKSIMLGLVISSDRAKFRVAPRGAEAEIQNSAS